MIFDFPERIIMRELQQRGDAALTLDQVEILAQIGSTDEFRQAIDRLQAKGLIVRHRFSMATPIEISLTADGRGVPIEKPPDEPA